MLKHFTDEGSFVHKYARRKNHHVFWARILGVAIVLFPLSLHHLDFRATFSLGLSVSAHKASPAYAALEDLRESYTVEVPSAPERVQQIAAGESFNVKTSHTPMSVRQVAMRGITIHAPVSLQPKPFYVAGEVRTYAMRKQLLVQEMKQEDWSIPTVSALAQELTEREMMIPPQRDERVIHKFLWNQLLVIWIFSLYQTDHQNRRRMSNDELRTLDGHFTVTANLV